jgi:hypothetical protein
MKQVITMITKIKIETTEDISKPNAVFNVEKKLLSDHPVAACSWLLPTTNRCETAASILKIIFNKTKAITPRLNFWCLVGDSAWQSDTSIIRHKKLWKRLQNRGVEISHFSESYEEALEENAKIKFFGAKLFSEFSISSVARLVVEEHCSYLLALPENIDIKLALKKGWNDSSLIDEDLLRYALSNCGFLLKSIGEFDDLENGFVGFGSHNLIDELTGLLVPVLSEQEETEVIPLTDLVCRWVACSNDMWLRWFASIENSADEFIDVDKYLLNLLVLEKSKPSLRNLSTEQFFDKLRVVYRSSVDASRQVCVRQRAGNIFCSGRAVSISKGDVFKVKSIDTMGTMQNGKPYVEVVYGEGYLLESLDLLDFVIEQKGVVVEIKK